MSWNSGELPPISVHASNRPEIRMAWRGPSLLVLDTQGGAGTHQPLSGFFFRETRYLDRFRFLINQEEPVCASVAEVASNVLEFTYIYPPVETRGGGGSGSGGDHERHGILSRGLDLAVRFTVGPASVEVTLDLTSRWNEQVELEFSVELGADFAGLFEAMGDERSQNAPVEARPAENGLSFLYRHPRLPLETRIDAGGGRWTVHETTLTTRLRLARQETSRLTLRIHAVDSEDELTRSDEEDREARMLAYHEALPRLHAAAETPLVALTTLALHDLGSATLLDGPADEWLVPAAGYPLYPATFGRDAATVSWQAAAFDHGVLASATAARLARLQGTTRDDSRDELPGRMIQQARRDPLSRLGEVPFDRYYGDVASPFMYIIALGNAYAWSGDRSLVERHWDPVRRVLDWAREHGDLDGDGYIEYRTRSEHGPVHQGWKDSDNAVVDEAGGQVGAPFAPCETQGYYLGALQFAAAFGVVMDRKQDAIDYWRTGSELKERFNRDFWLDDEGFVAFGLDADKRPLRVLTSNAGQCIATGIVSDENLPRLVRRIFAPDLFSGWGIRTLSTHNPSYNPLSYHLGSVWPVENSSILFGLRRYGFDDRAVELARALYDLALLWPRGRIPECVGGHARGERAHPGAYPRANSFQSWNQSVFPILLQSLLGARAVGALDLLALDPVLPAWLPEITIRRWRIGTALLSIRFWRDGDGASHYEVLQQEGTLHIVRQAPLDALGVGVLDRLGDLVRDVLPI
jgi:glycogen debranching enzyme